MPQDESWSWSKFAKGVFVGKNYAKAIVIGLCQVIILALLASVVYSIFNLRGCSRADKSDTRIGSNTGVVNQRDDHSNVSVNHYHFPLSDLFSFFSPKSSIKKEDSNT